MQNQLMQSRTASIMMFLAGTWIAISPIWISLTGWALTSIIATGVVVALAALVQYFWRVTLPSWVAALAAVWLFVSVFVFTSVEGSAVWNQSIAALVTFVLAFWDGVETYQVEDTPRHAHGLM